MAITDQSGRNFQDITTLTSDEKAAISGFAHQLRQRLGPEIKEIILFGSKVRGNSEKLSDIDVLIVLRTLSWEIKKTISELAAEENIKHNVMISTVRYDVKTWEDPVIKALPFVKAVREEGICL